MFVRHSELAPRLAGRLLRSFLMAICGLVCCRTAAAQLPQIRLDAIFPAGAQQGTTIEVNTVTGRDLDEADALRFSHPGIRAVQKVSAQGDPIAGQYIVSVDPAVPPGIHHVRVHGLFGISNPRFFRVDLLRELQEQEPNETAEAATLVRVPTILNGRSDRAGDVDQFLFTPSISGPIVIRAEAALLGSLMQPILELFDASGRQLTVSRRIRSRDAAIVHELQAGQQYVLRVRDVVYSGGPSHIYRLIVDRRPFVEAVLPASGSTPADPRFDLYGRFLPDGEPTELQIQQTVVRRQTVGVSGFSAMTAASDRFGFESPLLPREWVTNDGQVVPGTRPRHPVTVIPPGEPAAPGTSPVVTLPATVCGFFEAKRDSDAFLIHASKGDVIAIRVLSEQIGTTGDPILVVDQVVPGSDGVGPTYQRVATEDDGRQNPGGSDLPAVTSDPSYRLTAPADADYRIRLTDRYSNSRGDARLTWLVDVQHATPDFGLAVFDVIANPDPKQPSATGSISIRGAGTYALDVYAWRTPDCSGPIRLSAENLPAGLTCRSTIIPAGQTKGTLFLSAEPGLTPSVFDGIRVRGQTRIGEEDSSRTALIVSLVHDAVNGLPRTVSSGESLTVAVMKDPQPFAIQLATDDLVVSQNQQVLIPVSVTRAAGFDDKVDLSLQGAPGNVDVGTLSIPKGQDSGVMRLFFKDNAALQESTLFLIGTATVPYRRNPWLQERADQALQDAVALLEQRKGSLAEAQKAAGAAMEMLTAAQSQVTATEAQIADLAARQEKLTVDLKATEATVQEATRTLAARNSALTELQVSADLTAESVNQALQQIKAATSNAEAAAAQASRIAHQLQEAAQARKTYEAEVNEQRSRLETLTSAVSEAQAARARAESQRQQAEQFVQAADAARVAAETAAKKAAEATRPNNVNVRLFSPPRVLSVRPAIGVLGVSIPHNGQLSRGQSLAAELTLTRKNNFQGDVSLSLHPADAAGGLSITPAQLTADQTKISVQITATADAALGDRTSLVVRATGDVNGESRVSDLPVAIKVVE